MEKWDYFMGERSGECCTAPSFSEFVASHFGFSFSQSTIVWGTRSISTTFWLSKEQSAERRAVITERARTPEHQKVWRARAFFEEIISTSTQSLYYIRIGYILTYPIFFGHRNLERGVARKQAWPDLVFLFWRIKTWCSQLLQSIFI